MLRTSFVGDCRWFKESTTRGIFDVFPDEAGRQAHLTGKVAAALREKASEHFEQSPSIEKIDVVVDNLPPMLKYK